jgi:hypothetical protein
VRGVAVLSEAPHSPPSVIPLGPFDHGQKIQTEALPPPGGVPSGLSPFRRFKLFEECSEMRGDGGRQGVVLVFEALPNC